VAVRIVIAWGVLVERPSTYRSACDQWLPCWSAIQIWRCVHFA